VGDLETLKAVGSLGLSSDDIENRVDKLGTFSVMSLSPVVTGTALTKDAVVCQTRYSFVKGSGEGGCSQVVWSEKTSQGSTSDGVHGSWLQIDQDSSGHVLAGRGLIVVDVDSLELQIGGTLVGTIGLDTVLLRDDLPEGLGDDATFICMF
jgi:hypothetical protein